MSHCVWKPNEHAVCKGVISSQGKQEYKLKGRGSSAPYTLYDMFNSSHACSVVWTTTFFPGQSLVFVHKTVVLELNLWSCLHWPRDLPQVDGAWCLISFIINFLLYNQVGINEDSLIIIILHITVAALQCSSVFLWLCSDDCYLVFPVTLCGCLTCHIFTMDLQEEHGDPKYMAVSDLL